MKLYIDFLQCIKVQKPYWYRFWFFIPSSLHKDMYEFSRRDCGHLKESVEILRYAYTCAKIAQENGIDYCCYSVSQANEIITNFRIVMRDFKRGLNEYIKIIEDRSKTSFGITTI